jgi:hypothetical protein
VNPIRRIFSKVRTFACMARAQRRGWRAKTPIVVIQSDDWGSIRTSSSDAYEQLTASGYEMGRSPYSLDALETDEDLQCLFDTLGAVRDSTGRPACLTANVIVGNPDFERIEADGFREYHFEPVTATLDRTPGRAGVTQLWAEGLGQRLFVPQLHGREHVRYWEWLKALGEGNPEAVETFRLGMCGVPLACSKHGLGFYAPPYLDDGSLAAAGVDLEAMVRQGAELFSRLFGFDSASAIAPNYCWTDRVEELWSGLGVRYIQSGLFQLVGDPRRRVGRYLGQTGAFGAWYIVRNCVFEPAWPGDWVARCLKEVARALRVGQPAVICSHRINYMGSIRPENRREGLARLAALLRAIVARWPDVRFLGTDELGQMIEDDIREPDGLACIAPRAGECRTDD